VIATARRCLRLGFAVLTVGCGPALWSAPDEGLDASADALQFGAAADARVEQGAPTSNFGSSTTLTVDGSPLSEVYLRFAVTGAPRGAQSAKLRLYVYDGSADGPALFPTSNDWSEGAITWDRRPPIIGASLGDKASIASGSCVEYDVSAAVPGDGTYSFALRPTSSDGLRMYSREYSTSRPQLVVTPLADTSPPQVAITSPLSGTTYTTAQTVTVTASATDETGVAKVELSDNGALLCADTSSP
jgi:hypothetical protein